MKKMKLKKGDVVYLKSGSPQMTVEEVYNGLDAVFCKWFSGTKLISEEFDISCLVKDDKAA